MPENKSLEGQGRLGILEDVHVGDLVLLVTNGEFFKTPQGNPDRYVGYIVSLDTVDISLSTTPDRNKYHGYSNWVASQSRAVTKIETRLIDTYEILKRANSY